MYELIFTPQADSDLREIENNPGKKNILKAVRKTLGFMETNLRHPSLNTEILEPHHHGIYSFRIDKKYRALFFFDGELVEVFQITNHYKK